MKKRLIFLLLAAITVNLTFSYAADSDEDSGYHAEDIVYETTIPKGDSSKSDDNDVCVDVGGSNESEGSNSDDDDQEIRSTEKQTNEKTTYVDGENDELLNKDTELDNKEATIKASQNKGVTPLLQSGALDDSGESGTRSTGITTWEELQSAIDTASSGGTVKLTQDLTSGAGDSFIKIGSGIKVTLDLNGFNLKRTGGSSDENGCVLKVVGGTLTLTDTSSEKTGCVTGGNYAGVYVSGSNSVFNMRAGTIKGISGSGVRALYNGTFNMSGGTIAENQGGAHSATSGIINMSGGTITKNSGSGIYLFGATTFNMRGGIISENTAAQGGGIYSYQGTGSSYIYVNIYGGSIINNTASSNGGGLYGLKTTFNITGGTIKGNTANSGQGGGIWNQSGKVTLGACTITENNATGSGGGVYSLYGDLTISGSTISKNKAASGGGVVCSGSSGQPATLTMNSGTITENEASGSGGGVLVSATFKLNGGTISKNKAAAGAGVYMNGTFEMKNATIIGNIAADSSGQLDYSGGAGVYLWLGNFTMTSGSITNNIAESSCRYGGGGVLVGNFQGGSYDKKFTMNGGTISGNQAENGGGVSLINSSAYLYMNGGRITDNEATAKGGGVCAQGICYMTGGSISTNTAVDGGGVFLDGSGMLSLSGGAITNNTASNNGGGVGNTGSTYRLAISGGAIADNTAEGNGGGVYGGKTYYLRVNNKPFVMRNLSNGKDNNVYLVKDMVIEVIGELQQDAMIGVTTQLLPTKEEPEVLITKTYSNYNDLAPENTYFSKDNENEIYFLSKNANREVILTFHLHDFIYEGIENVLTATCKNTDGHCDIPAPHSVSLTLNAQGGMYNGLPYIASLDNLEEFNRITEHEISESDIEYFQGEIKLESAPTDAGIYIAKLSVEGETIEKEFEITKIPLTFLWSGNEFIYDGTEKFVIAEAKNIINGDKLAFIYMDDRKIEIGDYTAKIIGISGEKAHNYYIDEDEETANHNWCIIAQVDDTTDESLSSNDEDDIGTIENDPENGDDDEGSHFKMKYVDEYSTEYTDKQNAKGGLNAPNTSDNSLTIIHAFMVSLSLFTLFGRNVAKKYN